MSTGTPEVSMKVPLQISFRNMEGSEAMKANIAERVDKLHRVNDRITRSRVMVEAHHRRHHNGNLYHVRIDMTVPRQELVASREPHEHHSHTDVYVAIRDAFDAARRQLEAYARQRRGDVKSHEPPPHGSVAQLFPDQDYGWIASADGRVIYFHRNSLVNGDFDKLEVGAEVSFAEARGDLGPQASSVRRLGKHHYPEA
jgi:ribosomal subunit interface protein